MSLSFFSPEKSGLSFRKATPFLIITAFSLLAIFSGLIASTGANKLTYVMIGAVGALFIAAIPPTQMIPILALLCFTVIGQLEYFAGIKQGIWIPYALAIFLYLRLPGAYLQSPYYKYPQIRIQFGLLFLAFLLSILTSIAINTPSPLQTIAGGKNYLILWAIYLTIAFFSVPATAIEKIFKWLIPMAFIQLPFVLYQYFFVAAKRSTLGGRYGVAWDAIVGSFGGDPMRGGASGVMAFQLVCAIIYTIALYRQKLTSPWVVAAVFGISALSIGLAEVKVVVLLLPLGIGVLMLPDISKKPLLTATIFSTCLVLMIALLVLYDHMHYAGTGLESNGLGDLYKKSFGYSTDTDFINFETGEMGRFAALSFWGAESWGKDLLHGLFGFSPGASRSDSILTIGELAKKYPFRIDRSTAAQMLWELGVVGSLIFISMLISGSVRAFAASRRCHGDALRQATLQTVSAILIMNVVIWPYGRELLEVPAQTFMLMACLGYVAQVTALQKMQNLALPVAASQ